MKILSALLKLLGIIFVLAIGAHFIVPGGLVRLPPWTHTSTIYVCPMPEDAEVQSDRPGRCPKCGMDLVPASRSLPMETGASHAGHDVPAASQAAGHSAQETRPGVGHPIRYYCPMHPSYQSDRPGECPICNMTLVPMQEGEVPAPSSVPGHAITTIHPDRQQLIGVRFGRVERTRVSKSLRVVGRIDYDETRLAAVNLKFGGWVEDLYVKSTGQSVRKGDPVMIVYSPEVLEAERSFIVALAGASGGERDTSFARESLQSARERLLLWDFTPEQIDALSATKKPETRVTITSKVDGVVTRRNVVKGAAIQPGTNLFETAELSTVWVLADIYQNEVAEVAVGQSAVVTLATSPENQFSGTVSYVYPYLNESTRTVRARIEVPNPGGVLRPGTYGNVMIAVDLGEQLIVDDGAILDSGTRQIAFVDTGNGRFEPRELTLGAAIGGRRVVKSGLVEGESVVTTATFLIDSESRLKAALISGGGSGAKEAGGHEGHGGQGR